MNTLKYVGKCIGKACQLQTSEFYDVYKELKDVSALGPNTKTRKNKLGTINARIRSLAETRSLKKNIAKLNALRLAHNVLDAQRSDAVYVSSDLKDRLQLLKNRKNKHETEKLVEKLIIEEIKPIEKKYNLAMAPVLKNQKNKEIKRYIEGIQVEAQEKKNKQKQEVRKTAEVIMKQYPMLNINNPKDAALLNHFVNTRLTVLKVIGAQIGDASLNEDKVARDLFTSAAVEKLFNEIISDQMAEKNTGRVVRMPAPPTSTIPIVSQQQQQNTKKGRRKTRKMNNRR